MLYDDYIIKLKGLAVEKDKIFTEKLVPNAKNVLGVTLPKLRELAKSIAKETPFEFLDNVKFDIYEETFLYGLTLCYSKLNFDDMLPYLKIFISKIDNWAVCDSVTMTLRFKKIDLEKVFCLAKEYLNKESEFEKRFAIILIMRNFLDDQHIDEVVSLIDKVDSTYYYVRMAVAWTLCEIVIKQKDIALGYIPVSHLDNFTINKAISKCNDSFRVSSETKEFLKKYRRK